MELSKIGILLQFQKQLVIKNKKKDNQILLFISKRKLAFFAEMWYNMPNTYG